MTRNWGLEMEEKNWLVLTKSLEEIANINEHMMMVKGKKQKERYGYSTYIHMNVRNKVRNKLRISEGTN